MDRFEWGAGERPFFGPTVRRCAIWSMYVVTFTRRGCVCLVYFDRRMWWHSHSAGVSVWPNFLRLSHVTDILHSSQPVQRPRDPGWHPEHGGSALFRNIVTHSYHTACQPKRRSLRLRLIPCHLPGAAEGNHAKEQKITLPGSESPPGYFRNKAVPRCQSPPVILS